MLLNLKAEMVRHGVKVSDVAKVLRVSERTVRAKLTGESDFTVSEAFRLRDEVFPGLEFDYLFQQVS